MQLFITLTVIAVALVWALWRLLRTLRGSGDCGCGRGHDCPKRPHNAHNKKPPLTALLVALAVGAPLATHAGLPRSAPSTQGMSVSGLARLVNELKQLPGTQLHHLVVVKNGHIVAEVHATPYRATDSHTQYSVCKFLNALAIGLAVQDGLLSLDDRLVEILADKCPPNITPELNLLTVRHLLTMTAGKRLNNDIRDNSNDWTASWLAEPQQMPGKHFCYDTMVSFVLSAIVQRVTGRTMLDYLDERIFRHMGISDAEWELSPDSINTGGWGLRTSTETMAMLGQLLLQRGWWRGQQLVTADWVDQMTHDQLQPLGVTFNNPHEHIQSYGYHVVIDDDDSFRTQGSFGQLLYANRKDSLVIAINSATDNLVSLLHTVHRHVPQLSATGRQAKPTDAQLNHLCSDISVPLLPGQPWSDRFGPKLSIQVDSNAYGIVHVSISHADENAEMIVAYDDNHTERISLGFKQWNYSPLAGWPHYTIQARGRFSGLKHDYEVAANYAWPTSSRLEVQLHYVNWFSAVKIVFDLDRSQVGIVDNQHPLRPTTVTCTTDPGSLIAGNKASRPVWITAFAVLFISLIAAIALQKPYT